ncbi:MAG: CRISPR-associated endonuclease Cas2 [Gammaproteobacteria bacterium]|nr:CRISPR-associated endonuclease Cas2 [Gammaproteobacteria bacterium]
MRYYVFCFDIADDKVRYRVSRILLDYGDRVQGSVFELALKSHQEVPKILAKINKIINPMTDDLRYYYLSGESLRRSKTLQGERVKQTPAVIIV